MLGIVVRIWILVSVRVYIYVVTGFGRVIRLSLGVWFLGDFGFVSMTFLFVWVLI